MSPVTDLRVIGLHEKGVIWMPDAAALTRVIAATRKTLSGRELQLNVLHDQQLIDDLAAAYSQLLLFTALDSEKGATSRAELFDPIASAAMTLKKVLLQETGQKFAARQISGSFPNAADFDAFLVGLDRVIRTAETLTNENQQGPPVRLNRSVNKWFAGEILPPIFERNFGRKAGASLSDPSKSTVKPGRPFLRFAVAVMWEMGITISMETVRTALKDVRAGRMSRKGRKSPLHRPGGG